jgi:hypothetical protein
MGENRRKKAADAGQASVKDVEPQVKELIVQSRRTLRGLQLSAELFFRRGALFRKTEQELISMTTRKR